MNDTPLQTNTTESIEITEASNSIDPKACYIPTVQINTNLGTQPRNSTYVASTPKHLQGVPKKTKTIEITNNNLIVRI